jgi:hypothetical protein
MVILFVSKLDHFRKGLKVLYGGDFGDGYARGDVLRIHNNVLFNYK